MALMRRIVPLLAAAGIGGLIAWSSGEIDRPTPRSSTGAALPTKATVLRAVDGDTLVITAADRTYRVRVIGVDTPEIHAAEGDTRPPECMGEAAASFTDEATRGQHVVLRYQPERHDRYGRVLADVRIVSGRFASRDLATLLVDKGYARTLTIAPNTQHATMLGNLESRARTAHRGLWSTCAD